MDTRFFEQPILNSPYEYPAQHWELDETGQPTNKVIPRAAQGVVHHGDPQGEEAEGSSSARSSSMHPLRRSSPAPSSMT